jgi:cell fate regulator YaaT (PSP1 superfamily)
MSRQHLVRIGTLGQIGRFTSADVNRYARGARVICRTSRGLEVGEVLTPPGEDGEVSPADGTLLRGMTVADELLLARLERHRDDAYHACTALLAERGIAAVLMDVEQLFDGQSLYFYFLGEVTPALEAVTEELATTYETKVQFRRFAETLTHGCGPGCGTDQAQGSGCSDGACTSCALAGACASKR